MATQQTLNTAIENMKQSLVSATCDTATAAYWKGLLSKDYRLHSNGTIQSTISNPLAYFIVPLAGDGTRGRSHAFVIDQFCYALSQGWTSKAHVTLRGVNESAIKAGMAFARPRQDSTLGTVEGRQAASIVAGALMSETAKGKAAKEIVKLDTAKSNFKESFDAGEKSMHRASYNEAMNNITKLLETSAKRNAKPAAPAVKKVEQVAPEVAKPAKRQGKGKAA